ncbi:MAG: type II toxin-antitoxin system VapC family toxin [Armatimonadota bacterium]
MRGCLIDTNVVLRLANSNDLLHTRAVEAVRKLREQQLVPCISPQVVAEFWNVATRPQSANGLGWSPQDVLNYVFELLESVALLHDTANGFYLWLFLVAILGVQGKQVHDARLVATMLAHGVQHLLTFNAQDFARYTPLITVWDAGTV